MQLEHGRVSIELHTLRSAKGRPLLLLHALGGNANGWSDAVLNWNQGPVYALDFAGHGKSGQVRGGAYYPEYFLADADLALEEIGAPCAVVGAGVGAYVALLLAGARRKQVASALLWGGAGLDGGGSSPDDHTEFENDGFEQFLASASSAYASGTDPFVAQCERDIRPLDYVSSFAEAAEPLRFSAKIDRDPTKPQWWKVAFEANGGRVAPPGFEDAIRELASSVSD